MITNLILFALSALLFLDACIVRQDQTGRGCPIVHYGLYKENTENRPKGRKRDRLGWMITIRSYFYPSEYLFTEIPDIFNVRFLEVLSMSSLVPGCLYCFRQIRRHCYSEKFYVLRIDHIPLFNCYSYVILRQERKMLALLHINQDKDDLNKLQDLSFLTKHFWSWKRAWWRPLAALTFDSWWERQYWSGWAWLLHTFSCSRVMLQDLQTHGDLGKM